MEQGILNAASVEDWFTVTFGAGTSLTISVQNSPAIADGGTDFALDVLPSCGAPVLVSATVGQDLKQLTLGDKGPPTVIVCVRANHWKVQHPTYKLTFSVQTATVIERPPPPPRELRPRE
jgi:hypothetical protein